MRRGSAFSAVSAVSALSALVGVAVAAAPAPGVAGPAPAFRQEREVVPGGRGPNRLAVDVPLLAGSAARSASAAAPLLSDVRLFTAAGAEVPYLLVDPPRPEAAWHGARLLPVLATKTSSGFEADLGRTLRVDRLRLTGIPAPFLKRVRLEAGGDRSRWTLLASEGTLFDLPAEGLSRTFLEFPPGDFRYFRVTWDDTKSGTVPLPAGVAARDARGPAAAPPLRAAIPFERRGSEPGTSRYRLRLPAARLPIDAIEVVPEGGNVLRPARVEESRLQGSELVPAVLGRVTLRRAERDGLVAAQLAVPVSPPEEAELDLVVEDGGNPPLKLLTVEAVFSPLPWIYFESSGTEPLVARWGVAGLAAPRYDLEALRGAVTRGEPAVGAVSEARWGALRALAPPPPDESPDEGLSAGAKADASAFRFARRVPAGTRGLTALRLDAAVLAESPSLSDLRVVDAGDRQVPYVLEVRGEPLALDLPALVKSSDPRPREGRDSAAAGMSFYTVRLPYAGLPGARISLTTTARVFRRNVTVLSERVPRRVSGPEPSASFVTLASAPWVHADPSGPAPPLTLDLASPSGTELTLSVDDGDNAPLPIGTPKLLLPGRALRFFRPANAELRLLYGNHALGAPRYDIGLLAPRLLGAPATELALVATDAPAAGGGSGALGKKIFWVVLGAGVLLLLGLLARLLKREEPAG